MTIDLKQIGDLLGRREWYELPRLLGMLKLIGIRDELRQRNLESVDRFFTDDYRPEIYTEFGLDHVRRNSMLTVLRRHVPQVAPALDGVQNAFQPWKNVAVSS